ncbi:MAG: NADAR family protein [Rhodocyclaceae bacterium]|nr:NADAR family protein [Rhodocyclaceae bacterium]
MTREPSAAAKVKKSKHAVAEGSKTPITIEDVVAIRFYRANEKPFGAFSNLYPRPVEFEGRVYPTSEHAYQAGKASKPVVRDWILSAPTPSLAAMAAHGLYVWDVVPNWAQIKFDRMRAVLRAKFEQHADLKELLLATGDARLVEAGTVNNAVNRLWGEVDGKGENMLGVMLMELRSEYAGPKAKRPHQSGAGIRRTNEKVSSTSKRSPVIA